jgi:SurA N-terminal domain
MSSENTPKENEDVAPKAEETVVTPTQATETVVEAEEVAKKEEKVSEAKTEENASETKLTVKQKICKHWIALTILAIAIVVILLLSLWRGLFVAAVVDGEPISRMAVVKELEKRSGGQALDTMVIKKIILKSALERGVSISEEDVNNEIATLEERMSVQGSTLEMALSQQGLTLEQFREQIILQKALEKILEDKLTATDEEVENYLTQTKATVPAGMSEEEFKEKVREQIKSQKFGTEVETWLTAEKQKANIKYYVDYAIPVPGEDLAPVSEGEVSE